MNGFEQGISFSLRASLVPAIVHDGQGARYAGMHDVVGRCQLGPNGTMFVLRTKRLEHLLEGSRLHFLEMEAFWLENARTAAYTPALLPARDEFERGILFVHEHLVSSRHGVLALAAVARGPYAFPRRAMATSLIEAVHLLGHGAGLRKDQTAA